MVIQIPNGFRFLEQPCTAAYTDAAIAFWVNALAVAGVVAACIVLSIRQRSKAPDPAETRDGPLLVTRSSE